MIYTVSEWVMTGWLPCCSASQRKKNMLWQCWVSSCKLWSKCQSITRHLTFDLHGCSAHEAFLFYSDLQSAIHAVSERLFLYIYIFFICAFVALININRLHASSLHPRVSLDLNQYQSPVSGMLIKVNFRFYKDGFVLLPTVDSRYFLLLKSIGLSNLWSVTNCISKCFKSLTTSSPIPYFSCAGVAWPVNDLSKCFKQLNWIWADLRCDGEIIDQILKPRNIALW